MNSNTFAQKYQINFKYINLFLYIITVLIIFFFEKQTDIFDIIKYIFVNLTDNN